MATIKTDTFTEASDTALESHTSDSSGGWSGWNTTRMDVLGATDEVADDLTDTAEQYALGDEGPSDADQTCSVNGRAVTTSATFWFGPLIRGNGTNQDGYFVWLNGNGLARMFKIVSGSLTQLDSDYSSGIAATTYADVEVAASGTSITGDINSVNRFSATDSSITAAGNIGLTLRRGARITSLQADDSGAAGGRIMSSLVNYGGLAGHGGLAGKGGGLAG